MDHFDDTPPGPTIEEMQAYLEENPVRPEHAEADMIRFFETMGVALPHGLTAAEVVASLTAEATEVVARGEAEEAIASRGRAQREIEALDARVKSGDPSADWAIVMLGLDYSDRERAEALQRILDRGGRGVHSERWKILQAHGQGFTDEDYWEAVARAVLELTPEETLGHDREVMKRFKSQVRAVSEAKVPGWDWGNNRRRERVISHDDAVAGIDRVVEDELLLDTQRRIDLEEVLARTQLTDGEVAFLELAILDLTTAEIAERLDTTPAAIRRRRHDTFKKLKRAAEGQD